jgi:hypothetical protein
MEKFFIVEITWNLKGDSGHEVLAVTNAENAQKCFRHYVELEKSESYLEDFFNADGTIKEDEKDNIIEYTETDNSFTFVADNYEYQTELCLIEKTLWTEEQSN